jgi:hypothetical protein
MAVLQSYSSCVLLQYTLHAVDDRALLAQFFDMAAYTFEQVNDGSSVFSVCSPFSRA